MTWTLPAVVATGGMMDVAWGRQVAENVGWWQATRVCSTSGQWPMAWLSGGEPQYNVQGDVSPEMIYQSAGTWAAWFQMGNQHQPSTAFVPVGTICWFYGNLGALPSC